MDKPPHSHSIVHNESANRFETALDGQVALTEYRLQGDQMIFTHTAVPPPYRGRGIAKELVLAGFEFARKRNLRIVALCSYVTRVLQQHPEFAALPRKAETSPSASEFRDSG